VIRCLITDGSASRDERKWLDHAACWIGQGIELFQIREADLSARQLAELTLKVLRLPNPAGTKILVNDRTDVVLACHADGVHLRDGSPLPETFARPGFLITIACHDLATVRNAKGANYVLLAPIFKPLSKTDNRPPLGIEVLREAVLLSPAPVLALGGVTRSNQDLCLAAGAAGIAGISYFGPEPDCGQAPVLTGSESRR
jgi:thiamine-phosphate pyrophosphorylase